MIPGSRTTGPQNFVTVDQPEQRNLSQRRSTSSNSKSAPTSYGASYAQYGGSYANAGVPDVDRVIPASTLKTLDSGKTISASANNKQNNRSNEVRIGERIPDIYGTVLSIPDIIAKSYRVYISNASYDISYFCISRGDVDISEVKNNGGSITTGSYDKYGPNTSPITDTGNIGSVFVAPVDSTDGQSSILEDPVLLKAPGDAIFPSASSTLGPFIFENCNGVVVNMAAAGLFSSGWLSRNVPFKVRLQLVDDAGSLYGSVYELTINRNALAAYEYITHYVSAGFSGRMSCYIIRDTAWGASPESSVAHKRLWLTGLYGTMNMTESHFGNITTLRARAVANPDLTSADINDPIIPLGVPDTLKITCQATRQIPGTNDNFASIAEAVCTDSKLGNRTASEIDLISLYDLNNDIETYFGTSLITNFAHTFDDYETSFEEMINTICRVAFVSVYRQGPLIRFKFDGKTTSNKLLFNHRNKIPNSEKRTIEFGYLDDKDGVDFEYALIKDGARLHYILPSDESAINLETDGPVGITGKLQAYFHAHRQFARQQYQNTRVEFEATQEAELLTIGDKILVANNTRTETYDGEIVSKDGLVLTLSQPFGESGDATIYIQTVEGNVEAIGITPVADNDYEVTLDSDVTGTLSLDSDAYSRSVYTIALDADDRKDLFLVAEKNPTDNMTVGIIAVNYDDRYYDHDTDFIDLVVDADGELL